MFRLLLILICSLHSDYSYSRTDISTANAQKGTHHSIPTAHLHVTSCSFLNDQVEYLKIADLLDSFILSVF